MFCLFSDVDLNKPKAQKPVFTSWHEFPLKSFPIIIYSYTINMQHFQLSTQFRVTSNINLLQKCPLISYIGRGCVILDFQICRALEQILKLLLMYLNDMIVLIRSLMKITVTSF